LVRCCGMQPLAVLESTVSVFNRASLGATLFYLRATRPSALEAVALVAGGDAGGVHARERDAEEHAAAKQRMTQHGRAAQRSGLDVHLKNKAAGSGGVRSAPPHRAQAGPPATPSASARRRSLLVRSEGLCGPSAPAAGLETASAGMPPLQVAPRIRQVLFASGLCLCAPIAQHHILHPPTACSPTPCSSHDTASIPMKPRTLHLDVPVQPRVHPRAPPRGSAPP
jgi:hypothetical protein